MPLSGDVVVVEFPGAHTTKRRPAVVVSSHAYHQTRPDVILGVITSNLADATASTDHALQDWQTAGLRKPSAFRSFLITVPANSVQIIGHLSPRDWESVLSRVHQALA